MNSRICFYFQQGRCRKGAACNYSHGDRSSSYRQPKPKVDFSLSVFMKVPGPRKFQNPRIIHRFVACCISELKVDPTRLMQHLSGPEGVEYLRSFVDWAPEFSSSTVNESNTSVSLERVVVPFFSMILTLVAQSVLMKEANTITSTLSDALIFSNVKRCLPLPSSSGLNLIIEDSNIGLKIETWADVWSPLTAFMRRLLSRDPNLIYEESARQLTDALIEGAIQWTEFKKSETPRSLREDLRAIEALTRQGRQNEKKTDAKHLQMQKDDKFQELFGTGLSLKRGDVVRKEIDGPGELSVRGVPRHDNDFVDYRKIQLGPTQEEVLCPLNPYLPKTGAFSNPDLSAIDQHLDHQFRLLRHDMLAPLLSSAPVLMSSNPYLTGEIQGGRLTVKKEPGKASESSDLFVFKNVEVLDLVGKKRGENKVIQEYYYTIEFDQRNLRRRNNNMLGADKSKDRLKKYWEASRHLPFGALICLWVHRIEDKPELIFATISERNVDASPSLVHSTERARIGIMPCDAAGQQALCAICYGTTVYKQHMTMLEVSQGYFSFYFILGALQALHVGTMPLPNYLVATGDTPSNCPAYINPNTTFFDLSLLARACADKELVEQLKHVAVGQPDKFPLVALMEASTLDEGQAKAMMMALTKEFALIQGPPGTGKTYVGVKIVQMLLYNTKSASKRLSYNTGFGNIYIGPIVCVCLTNHALDQFLCALLDVGITQLVRIGGRSKMERLDECNLNVLMRRKNKRNPTESFMISKAHEQLEHQASKVQELEMRLESLCNKKLSWFMVEDVVDVMFPNIYEYITNLAGIRFQSDSEDGYQTVHNTGKGDPLYLWLTEGRVKQNQVQSSNKKKKGTSKGQILTNQFNILGEGQRMNVDLLPQCFDQRDPVTSMNTSSPGFVEPEKRRGYLDQWRRLLWNICFNELQQSLKSFQEAKDQLTRVQDNAKMNTLSNAQVVGLTTSGMARHRELITAVKARVIVVEEAAEVLEAHILACLSESTQHIILIGDHLQLRPKCEQYELKVESGKGYNLDMSLFERLVTNNNHPIATLSTQRRMHPSISRLIREPIYPHLHDSASVLYYPEVKGMERRLFFLDHDGKEQGEEEDSDSSSKKNYTEVEWVVALTKYLLQQGYEADEIAVLTPYVGQLQELRLALQAVTMVFVDEADAAALADLNDEDDSESEMALVGEQRGQKNWRDAKKREDMKGKSRVDTMDGAFLLNKTSLKSMIRMATIDNFQGEEAKIIIMSLVRNNSRGSIGFLRIPNRANVLLSRAMHGMYMFGNADTLRTKTRGNLWPQVLTMLEEEGNFGRSLALRCPNHPGTFTQISDPRDFNTYAKEGGCNLPCGSRLPCGHACSRMCHILDKSHVTTVCTGRCMKARKCGHPCEQICGVPCPSCPEPILVDLLCNHQKQIPCGRKKMLAYEFCSVKVDVEVEGCGHKLTLNCTDAEELKNDPTKCSTICSTRLPCGDVCLAKCGLCLRNSRRISDDPQSLKITSHCACRKICGRMQLCGHSCPLTCHVGDSCPSCALKCELQCVHTKCPRYCVDICALCIEPCVWQCKHQGKCPLPCSAPCVRMPCDLRCDRELSCGHRCPSLCGEVCPDPKLVCPPCVRAQGKDYGNQVVDLIMSTTLVEHDPDESPLVLLTCGHIYTVETLDGHLGMIKSENNIGAYERDPVDDQWISAVPLKSMHSELKVCPQCRSPIRGINRYGRLLNHSVISLTDKKFMLYINPKLSTRSDMLTRARNSLESTVSHYNKLKTVNVSLLKATSVLIEAAIQGYRNLVNICQTPPSIKAYKTTLLSLRRANLSKELLPPEPDMVPLCTAHLGLGKAKTIALKLQSFFLEFYLNLGERSAKVFAKKDKKQLEDTLHKIYKGAIKSFQKAYDLAVKTKCNIVQPIILQEQANLFFNRLDVLSYCDYVTEDNILKLNSFVKKEMVTDSNIKAESVDINSEEFKLLEERKSEKLKLLDETERILCLAKKLSHSLDANTANDKSNEIMENINSMLGMIPDMRDKINRPAEFYEEVTAKEKHDIWMAMPECQGAGCTRQGHWYTCPNGHLYTIGECGGAMQASKCPQCGATIGGHAHQLDSTNKEAREFVSDVMSFENNT